MSEWLLIVVLSTNWTAGVLTMQRLSTQHECLSIIQTIKDKLPRSYEAICLPISPLRSQQDPSQ